MNAYRTGRVIGPVGGPVVGPVGGPVVGRVLGRVVIACAATLLAGCGATTAPNQPTTEVKLSLSDAGCEPAPASVPSGPVKFTITNSGSAKVTEAELQKDGKILGEKESLKIGRASCRERV